MCNQIFYIYVKCVSLVTCLLLSIEVPKYKLYLLKFYNSYMHTMYCEHTHSITLSYSPSILTVPTSTMVAWLFVVREEPTILFLKIW